MKKNIIIPMKIMARKSYHESLSYRESKSRLFQWLIVNYFKISTNNLFQQHPPFFSFFLLNCNPSVYFLGCFSESGRHSKISLANLLKTSSMFILSFADVSKNETPKDSANFYPSSFDTTLSFSRSHLLPTKNLTTLAPACFLISFNQLLMLLKDSLSVIS